MKKHTVKMSVRPHPQVLGEKDLDAFLDLTLDSLLLIVSISFLKTARVYVQKRLVVSWRRTLTSSMHRTYFVNVRFYQLNVLGG